MKYNYFKSCLVLSLLSFLIGCSVNENNLELNSDTSGLSPKEHKEVLNSLQGKQMQSFGSSSNSAGGSSDSSTSGLLMPDSQILLLPSSNFSCEEKDTVDVFSETITISHVNKYESTLHLDNEIYTICYYYYWQENRKDYYDKLYYYDDQFQLSYIEETKNISVADSQYQNHKINYNRIKNNDDVIKYNSIWETYNDDDNVLYIKESSNNDVYTLEGFYSNSLDTITDSQDTIIEIDYFNIYYPKKSIWNSKVSFDPQTFKINFTENETLNLDISLIVNKDEKEYVYYTYFSMPDPTDIDTYIYTSREDRIAQINPVGKYTLNDDLSMDIYYLDDTGNYSSVSQ